MFPTAGGRRPGQIAWLVCRPDGVSPPLLRPSVDVHAVNQLAAFDDWVRLILPWLLDIGLFWSCIGVVATDDPAWG